MNRSILKQNQPPLSYFDKSFADNPGDALFCSLNDINPIFLGKDTLVSNECSQPQTVDPRTRLPITQPIYDHTKRVKPDIFKCINRSLLTKREHSICVAFLNSLKAKRQIVPHQLQCFEETAIKRQNERNAFLQFLLQYNNANYEKIYAPGLMFVELYQRLYKLEAQRLMKKHRDGVFQIHTGFPIPRTCGNSEMFGSVSDMTAVSSFETPRSMDFAVDLSKMRPRIETYFELYTNRETLTPVSEEQTQFEISTEALVFLLCAGEYIDIPTEVLVRITADDDGECRIHINDPLPSRNTGLHTSELIARKCTEVFLELGENNLSTEIQATGFNERYSPQTFESFMNKHKPKLCATVTCSTLVKWKLILENETREITVLTRTATGYKDTRRDGKIYHSLKLEYKPQFGCEILSKASLLREWIEQRLSTSPHSSTDRHRINASTFTTILHEKLSIDDIEQELDRHYHIKMPRLLGSLGDFLNLLSKVSPGRYLLQYNRRFKDKLMLYAENKDATSKSCVTLHGLLKDRPSDMDFMTLRQLTSIDDLLCSAMHNFYQVLPCSFPPWRQAQTHKLIDDRDYILRKVQEKANIKAAKETKRLERRKKVKYMKKKQKAKKKNQQKEEDRKETLELEEDIKHDRLLYGFNDTEAEQETFVTSV